MRVNKNRVRKGQALVEYTIILAAVALISLGTISLLGHKTTDMLGTLTAILPGLIPTTMVRLPPANWCRQRRMALGPSLSTSMRPRPQPGRRRWITTCSALARVTRRC